MDFRKGAFKTDFCDNRIDDKEQANQDEAEVKLCLSAKQTRAERLGQIRRLAKVEQVLHHIDRICPCIGAEENPRKEDIEESQQPASRDNGGTLAFQKADI